MERYYKSIEQRVQSSKLKQDYFLVFSVIFISLFFLSSPLRKHFIQIPLFNKVSVFLLIGLLLLFVLFLVQKSFSIKKISALTFLFLLSYVLLFSVGQQTFVSYRQSLILVIIPLFICCCSFKKRSPFLNVFRLWTWFLRITILLMVLTILVDLLFSNSATRFIANFTQVESYFRMLNQGRSVTFLGHSLFSASVFLIFLCNELLFANIFNKPVPIWVFFSSIIGFSSTQSRTTIVLFIIVMLFYVIKYKKYKIGFSIILLFLFLAMIGMFDGILGRFVLGFESGDFSSGRNSSLEYLTDNDLLGIKIIGGSMEYNSSNNILNMAMEYPIVSWMINYGIFGFILFFLILFVYPVYQLIHKKNMFVLFIYLIVFIQTNSFAGLNTAGVQPILFYFSFFFILNSGLMIEKKKNKYPKRGLDHEKNKKLY